MALVSPPETPIGTPCPPFALPDASGRIWTREELTGPNGLVVAFICNHCPYVVAMAARLAQDFETLRAEGIGGCCIMSNDWTAYPADDPARMEAFAAAHSLSVPYLVDETQDIARAFGAVCTPDLFGYGRALDLGYRGRLDDAGRGDGAARRPELLDAMMALAADKPVAGQVASMGCSIKWR